ncbi:MAG: ABC transporter ATP-binding protein [Elusimicrobia bacterium]|nr:ABC transporter ATP-binding protein [Elusimicrobiota bacterium]
MKASSWRLGETLRVVRSCRILDGGAYLLLGIYYLLIPVNTVIDGASWLMLVRVFMSADPAQSPGTPIGSIDPWLTRLGLPVEPVFLLKATIALFAVKAALTVGMAGLEGVLQAGIRRRIQERCFANLMQGRWEAMRLDNVGRWVGSLTEETAAFSKYLVSLLHAGYALAAFLILAAMAFAVEPRVCLLMGGIGAMAWGVLSYVYGAQAALSKSQVQARQGFASDITERLEGLFQIKAAGETTPYLRTGLRRQEEMTSAEVSIGWLAGLLTAFNAVLLCLVLAAYYLFEAVRGRSALGGLDALGSVGVLGFRAITQLNYLIGSLGNLTRLAGSIDPVLRMTTVLPEIEKRPLPEALGEIRLEGVGYDFDGRCGRAPYGKSVLKGQDLVIRPGRIFLITGPSGSGKTTLANLIAGLYEPTAGRIVYVGASGAAYDSREHHPRIGYVTQDVRLFTGSVRDNLDPWRKVSDEDLGQCLRETDAAGFVERLGGLDGAVAEGGRSLSGGEKRRLAIARAIAQKCDCLVLDEVTSGLDARNKAELLDTIGRLGSRVLIIAIAHDTATYDAVDRTLFELTPLLAQGGQVPGGQTFSSPGGGAVEGRAP